MHHEPQPGDLGVAPQSPQGVSVFFLSPDHARDLAKHLAEYSTVAGSGLVIAGADQIPVTNPEQQP